MEGYCQTFMAVAFVWLREQADLTTKMTSSIIYFLIRTIK